MKNFMPSEVISEEIFNNFQKRYNLNAEQIEQFKLYLVLLNKARTQFNLTAIDTYEAMIELHFKDSLALADCFDLTQITMIADVGTGAGFPGIPLKILFPHLHVVLIEVSTKKRAFLDEIIEKLQLNNIEISSLDWRNFLRKARYPIDLFLARASLHTDELMRMFQPSCYFQDATLVYWASRHWELTALEKPFFQKKYEYSVLSKNRKLVFFKMPL